MAREEEELGAVHRTSAPTSLLAIAWKGGSNRRVNTGVIPPAMCATSPMNRIRYPIGFLYRSGPHVTVASLGWASLGWGLTPRRVPAQNALMCRPGVSLSGTSWQRQPPAAAARLTSAWFS